MTTLQFTALVQQYQGLVFTVCNQLVHNEALAQDLAQEAFLSAWRSIERCPQGYERQWLARIAANKAKDHLRSAWARRETATEDETMALRAGPPGQEPEEAFLRKEGAEDLRRLVLDLREPYRTPCRLHFLEGRSIEETARLSGRPPKTVTAQLSRARKMLREQLAERSDRSGVV